MNLRVRQFAGYTELPNTYADVLAEASRQGLFHSREWFEFLMGNVYSVANEMRLYAVEDVDSGLPLLLAPLRLTQRDAAVKGARTLASIGHVENFAPACFVLVPGVRERRRELLGCLFAQLRLPQPGNSVARMDVLRFWPFAVNSELGVDVREAMREAGFLVQAYANSYNQYEDTAGVSYTDYFAKRSSNQRYNSRRRRRNLEKDGELQFEMLTDDSNADALAKAVDDYILASVHSWKPVGSTVSASIFDLMRIAASKGALRLGILRFNGKPIAAQFWILSGGVASAIRPNFHDDYKKYAPGVVLSNFVIEYLLDIDKATCLDFGYGNDEYKEKWMKDARHYCGFMAFNPGTPRGLYFGVKHILGQTVKRALLRGKALLRGQPDQSD